MNKYIKYKNKYLKSKHINIGGSVANIKSFKVTIDNIEYTFTIKSSSLYHTKYTIIYSIETITPSNTKVFDINKKYIVRISRISDDDDISNIDKDFISKLSDFNIIPKIIFFIESQSLMQYLGDKRYSYYGFIQEK